MCVLCVCVCFIAVKFRESSSIKGKVILIIKKVTIAQTKIICSYIVFGFFVYSDLLLILKLKNIPPKQGRM